MKTVRFQGSSGAGNNTAEVTADHELKIKPSSVNASNVATRAAGGLRFKTENDFGQYTHTYLIRDPEVTTDYRLRCGLDTLLFFDNFNMTAQNTTIWKTVFTGMTLTAGGGFLLFNTGLSSTAANGVNYSTWRTFSVVPMTPIYAEGTFEWNAVPQGNQVFEFGFFLPPAGGTTTPVDGCYFRLTSDGLAGCVNYNGIEITTGDVITDGDLILSANLAHTLYMEVDTRQVQFWIDDLLLGTLTVPQGTSGPFMSAGLPMTMQQRNTGTVLATTPLLQVKCGNCAVFLGDAHSSKPWPHQMAGLGQMAMQLGNGATPTIATCMTALYTNNLAAGAGVLMTNTTAALGVGLGGQLGALPTLAVPTEGVLSSYQNPAGTVNIAPRTLYITGVRIQGAVTTTLTGGPVLYAYALCYGHTSVSLAQTETGSFVTGTTKAPRRFPLGFETYASGAIAGVLGGPGINVEFQTPVVVNPGEFIAVSAKNLGVVTTLGVINVLVMFNGYFE